jgi:DNA-binding FadR family transcriptional regulator
MEVWELRYILESTVAGIAAERATDEEISEIQRTMRDYELNVKQGIDESLTIVASQNFHNSVVKAAHNEILLDMFENVSSLLSMSREVSMKVEGSSNRAVEYHARIAQAIANRDVKRAKNEMERHLLDVKNDLLISLECLENDEKVVS